MSAPVRWQPLPSRELPDATADIARREHARAIEELRRYVEALERRIYALENP